MYFKYRLYFDAVFSNEFFSAHSIDFSNYLDALKFFRKVFFFFRINIKVVYAKFKKKDFFFLQNFKMIQIEILKAKTTFE